MCCRLEMVVIIEVVAAVVVVVAAVVVVVVVVVVVNLCLGSLWCTGSLLYVLSFGDGGDN